MIRADRAALQRSLPAVAFVAVSAATVMIVRGEPDLSLAGDSAAALAAELVAAALLIAAATATWRAGAAFPVLLAAAALAWLAAEWNTPGAGPAFTAGLVLYAAWPPLLAAAALRGLDERPLGRPAAVLLAVAFVSCVGVLGLASAAVFDPEAQGCVQCPANLLLVAGDAGLGHDLGRAGLALTATWTAAFAVLATAAARALVAGAAALGRTRARSGGRRRGAVRCRCGPRPRPRLSLQRRDGPRAAPRGGGRASRWSPPASRSRGCAPGAPAPRWRGSSSTSAPLPRPASFASGSPTRSGTRRSSCCTTSKAASGSTPKVARPRFPPPASARRRACAPAGEEVLAVVHRPGLLDDPALVAELATTASLALEHERLHAARRARLEELRASRARIVAAADAERRALERDLHDGAQQRLVAVALAIRLARHRIAADDPALDAALAAAEARVRAAVVELRDVAHGLFPTVLADEGLRAALDELSEHAPRFVPRAVPVGRFPGEVESAAYFAAVEALRLAEHGVTMDAAVEDGSLRLVIGTGTALDAALMQIRDRVGAVGGTMAVQDGELRLEMPCAS